MCCLFGIIDCGRTLTGRQKEQLVRALAAESEARGTDAAGVAYNSGGRLHIFKRPGAAHTLNFFVPEDARAVMGHSRLTTQGNARCNRNNHPFAGAVPGVRFALAHNGVLYNDVLLKKDRKLPKTAIETDSYVAVQLLEQAAALTPASLKDMAESVEGSFVFTLLDERDHFWFVRGDNPLCLLHFPRLDLYVYASTREILALALKGLWLEREPGEAVPTEEGDILSIAPDGTRTLARFTPAEHSVFRCFAPGGYALRPAGPDRQYLCQLKRIAAAFGYSEQEIEMLLHEGWTTDEIEEMLYSCSGLGRAYW